ncbi:MAG TPA: sterol desaturase family protein [Candidatus Binatia bacterium]|jgi:sterol desaturase/sphingolipid hydroxylase (fatty acid hydroxylase superfamily)
MTPLEFLRSIGVIVALMAIAALLETVVPLFGRGAARRGRQRANLGLTVLTFAGNWALASAAALVPLATGGHGLVQLGLAPPLQILASVALLDFCTYLAHRSMHVTPELWRVHRVHHSDPFVDVSTTYRQHPIEGLWRFLWITGPAAALGLPASGVIAYRLVSAVNALAEHANVPLWRPLDTLLSLVWVTPNMHKVHHSRACAETDTNYGNILAVYDRLLETFTPSARAYGVRYGLDDVDAPEATSFGSLLAMPLRGLGEQLARHPYP